MRYLSMFLLAMLLMAPAWAAAATIPDAAVVAVDAKVPVADAKVPVADGGTKEPVVPKEVVVPTTDAEAGELIGMLLNAAQNGHWTIVGGLLLLLIMWVFNRMGLAARIGRDYVPWVTVGLGAVGFIAVGLSTGASVLDALKLGILEGGIAIALWELVFKRLTGEKVDGELRETPRADPTP